MDMTVCGIWSSAGSRATDHRVEDLRRGRPLGNDALHHRGRRKVQISDDYLTTSAERVRTAIADKACNAVLLKPNQRGR
jgi:hypothetical protein